MTATASATHDLDLALARAIQARDRKATAEFVKLYADGLHRYVYFRLSPRVEAVEDLVQEVFLTALQSLGNYHGQGPLRGWLMGIARHKVQDHFRAVLRSAPMPEEAEEIPDGATPLEVMTDGVRNRAMALEVLGELPDHYRAVLLWRYWEERTAQEIAGESGRSVKGVERLLARARAQFRDIWLKKEARR